MPTAPKAVTNAMANTDQRTSEAKKRANASSTLRARKALSATPSSQRATNIPTSKIASAPTMLTTNGR